MSIQEKRAASPYLPLKEANLEADNFAELHAVYEDSVECFKVGASRKMPSRSHGTTWWHFDEAACREAAEFFTTLADDLKERNQ